MEDVEGLYQRFAAEHGVRVAHLRNAVQMWDQAQSYLAQMCDAIATGELDLIRDWPDDAGNAFLDKLRPCVGSLQTWSAYYGGNYGYGGRIRLSKVSTAINDLANGLDRVFPEVDALWRDYTAQLPQHRSDREEFNRKAFTDMQAKIASLDGLYATALTAMNDAHGDPWPGPVGGASPGGPGVTSGAGGAGPAGAGGAGAESGDPGAPAAGDLGDLEAGDPGQTDPGQAPADSSSASSDSVGGSSDSSPGGSTGVDAVAPGDLAALSPTGLTSAAGADVGGYPSLAGGGAGIGGGGLGGGFGGGGTALAPVGNPAAAGLYDGSLPVAATTATTAAAGAGSASAVPPMMYPPSAAGGAKSGGGVRPGDAEPTGASRPRGRKAGAMPGVALTGRVKPESARPGSPSPRRPDPGGADHEVLDEELWLVNRTSRSET
ncbi:hypothetical protein ABT369_09220 [Dactylosporangium sp. NPDC000244]|uniref:hypothetical protein n=1 Tax=Dactylosporangium sp. NPDC000244 TaxID=3154365 RepID=UPI00331EAC53